MTICNKGIIFNFRKYGYFKYWAKNFNGHNGVLFSRLYSFYGRKYENVKFQRVCIILCKAVVFDFR